VGQAPAEHEALTHAPPKQLWVLGQEMPRQARSVHLLLLQIWFEAHGVDAHWAR
jgi:hypothetical protein